MGLTCKEQASALKNRGGWRKLEGDELDECAAYTFLQAYALRPGWAIVDYELDMLEDEVDQMPRYLKYLQESWNPSDFNLRSILATFRYKME